jgi:hypothetical protein
VYVQEAPSGTHTIIGVSTSTTAFIGNFTQGPVNTAVRLLNFGDFERVFGGLSTDSEASYALQQYFLNDGDIAWVVRVVTLTAATASVPLQSSTQQGGSAVMQLNASSPGMWGNSLYVDIDYNTSDPATLFNLTASQVGQQGGRLSVLSSVTSRNLSMTAGTPSYVQAVLAQTSDALVLATNLSASGALPVQTGVTSGPLTNVSWSSIGGQTMQASVQTGTGTPQTLGTVTLPALPNSGAYTIYSLPDALQGAINQVPGLSTATVQVINNLLRVQIQDLSQASAILTFSGNLATALAFTGSGSSANVQRYVLGGAAGGAQGQGTAGADGDIPGATEILGSAYQRTGLYALDAIDVFNLLCIPGIRNLSATSAFSVIQQATAYCEARRAFFLAEMPASVNSIQDAVAWVQQNATLASSNNAVYFPSLMIADPLNNYRLRAVGPSGTLAGVYARIDANRGVWQAPAGVIAVLAGVQALSYRMTDDENGVLNPLAVNALRTFPNYGNIAWGARTLVGSDARGSEWKYIPVRRIALYIEESLRQGLQWAVFQPNGEVLWAQIRLNVSAFLHGMFIQGAFKGETPQQAYFVNCDASTTSQNDINQGIVNVVVGFAPLKPAEFVIITLEQMAGQVQT